MNGASNSGGGGGFATLNRQYQAIDGEKNKLQKGSGGLGTLDGVYQAGYDANGNEQLIKWQGQDEDKSARFLAKVHNQTDISQYDDSGFPFYDGDYQKFSLAVGLNDKPQVVSDKVFDKLVAQNNLQVLYRGESGQAAVDRFLNAENSHTGVGSYGDGFYFSEDKYTANSYASMKGGRDGRVLKMALSPNARIITYSDLRAKMASAGVNLSSALSKQGGSSSGGYHNDGEAQFALKLGYNVISDCGYNGSEYHFALTRDAFIVSRKAKNHW